MSIMLLENGMVYVADHNDPPMRGFVKYICSHALSQQHRLFTSTVSVKPHDRLMRQLCNHSFPHKGTKVPRPLDHEW